MYQQNSYLFSFKWLHMNGVCALDLNTRNKSKSNSTIQILIFILLLTAHELMHCLSSLNYSQTVGHKRTDWVYTITPAFAFPSRCVWVVCVCMQIFLVSAVGGVSACEQTAFALLR